MKREFTASTYILHEQKVLLIFHKKFQKWLPPGGHVELNETPAETAIREAKEETGLDIEFIQQENVWFDYPNTTSIPRPYLCQLCNVPPYQDTPAHQHIDFVYIAKPMKPLQAIPNDCRWFDSPDIHKLQADIDVFRDTLDIILHLKKDYLNLI